MSNEIRQFIRREDGQPVGIMVANENGIGWAVTHPRDRFNKELGLRIARGRAVSGSEATPPRRVREQLRRFQDRASRYFKE